MASRVPSYLRTQRRKWGLTQRELALLIGSRSRAHVSRLERDQRAPSVHSLIAALVIFGESAPALFPHLYGAIEEEVLRSAAKLLEELSNDSTRRGARKRELLESVLHRAITSINNNKGT